MDGVLGIGIVGSGWVAREHARAFAARADSRVVAVLGRTREGLEAFARDTGLRARTYLRYEEFLDDPEVQAVVVCTPNDRHAPQAIAALEAGRHVLVEKPAACSPAELEALERAARRADRRVLCGFVLHWNPLLVMLRRLLAQGVVGRPFYLEADYLSGNWEKWYVGYPWIRTRAQGVSALLSAGCHAVDALLQLHPGPVREVVAYHGSFTGTFEYEATVVALLRYADGAIGKVANVIEGNTPYQFRLRVHGPEGTIVDNRIWSRTFEGQTDWVTLPTVLPDSADVAHHPFAAEAAAFVDAVRTGRDGEVGLAHAARVHRLIFAMEESARRGQPVAVNDGGAGA